MTSRNQAKSALNGIKMQAANEVGVTLKEGYNGDLTSRQAGSIGGQMVKKMCPEVIMNFKRINLHHCNHEFDISYYVTSTI